VRARRWYERREAAKQFERLQQQLLAAVCERALQTNRQAPSGSEDRRSWDSAGRAPTIAPLTPHSRAKHTA